MTSMAKNLLLGSTAALATIATAQAADLPGKAKPVEYVKVCTVYGVGFYYIPGTDACLKVGGHVRLDIGIFAGGNHAPYFVGAAARDNREDTPFYQTRSRGVISFDARSQTEWGTMRAYLRAGWEMNSAPTVYGTQAGGFVDTTYRGATYWDRAFMQFAGLTVGKTQSFFDFYANALSYVGQITAGSDTGLGINLVAYTFEFGGGFSGTISLEDTVHRRTGIWDATTRALVRVRRRLAFRRPTTATMRPRPTRTWWRTCTSTSPGVLPRSWPPCMTPTEPVTAGCATLVRACSTTVRMRSAGQSAAA
jgi:Porin subfamily